MVCALITPLCQKVSGSLFYDSLVTTEHFLCFSEMAAKFHPLKVGLTWGKQVTLQAMRKAVQLSDTILERNAWTAECPSGHRGAIWNSIPKLKQ